MSTTKTLTLEIVTQERQVLQAVARSVTITTVMGEITVLPDHIPLFTRLVTGELRYVDSESKQTVVYAVSGGFMDVGVGNKITVLADDALRADDINEALVDKARQEAEEAMKNKTSERDFLIAEAALRKALNELKIAQKRKSGNASHL
jgi:F-type H+-transporting ATPase subunit epsilon